MDPDDYEELRKAILLSPHPFPLNGSFPLNGHNDFVGTWKGKNIDANHIRGAFDILPRSKYKEIGDAGNWRIVSVYDREVRNWLKEQELHLWSQNTDGSYDVHNDLWFMLCLRWEQ